MSKFPAQMIAAGSAVRKAYARGYSESLGYDSLSLMPMLSLNDYDQQVVFIKNKNFSFEMRMRVDLGAG